MSLVAVVNLIDVKVEVEEPHQQHQPNRSTASHPLKTRSSYAVDVFPLALFMKWFPIKRH